MLNIANVSLGTNFKIKEYMKQNNFWSFFPVGPLRIEFSISVNLDEVKKTNPNVKEGGRYKPKDCKAVQKVALIIPFRNRDEHLKYWLYYLHPILQRQQLDYGVYVINQVSGVFFFPTGGWPINMTKHYFSAVNHMFKDICA